MKLDEQYYIVKRKEESFLVNIENGDIYKLNDISLSVFDFCEKADSLDSLVDLIYNLYCDTNGDGTRDDLVKFIKYLTKNKIIHI